MVVRKTVGLTHAVNFHNSLFSLMLRDGELYHDGLFCILLKLLRSSCRLHVLGMFILYVQTLSMRKLNTDGCTRVFVLRDKYSHSDCECVS